MAKQVSRASIDFTSKYFYMKRNNMIVPTLTALFNNWFQDHEHSFTGRVTVYAAPIEIISRLDGRSPAEQQ